MLLQIIVLLLLRTTAALHHKLNKRELKHVFGVDHKHQVPSYDLIKPEKSRTEDGRLRIRFRAWNESYDIQLSPNNKLLSPHLVSLVRSGANNTEHYGLPRNICHFKGKVSSHSDAPVAISDCRTLMGTLHLDDHFLILQSVPKRVEHHQEEKHLVFKRSAGLLSDLERNLEEEIIRLNEIQEPFCDTSESMDDPTGGSILSLNYTIPSSAQLDSPVIFPNMDPITLEIGLFLDSKLYDHFKREYIQDAEEHLTDFSLALINNVHVLYQQSTLSPNIEIVIVRFELWRSQPSNLETFVHKGGQAQSLLDAFCRHQAHINPGTDLTDMGHWDHGVLLTGYDIYHTTASVAGVAPVARMCDPLFACSLVEGLHLGRSFVLAHEMGHNMGMVHDGVQNQCSRSCCLMSAVNGAGKTTWSECSVREFNAFLQQLDSSGQGNCLRDASPGLITHNHLDDNRSPGQRFTADQQCSYFWGREYHVEVPAGRAMDDICRILWCGDGGSTISTAHPALQGSYCGNGKWCHEGRCRGWPNGPAPEVVDGGWSSWSSETQCPVQQCHITGSITIKAQHRDCVDPAPNNGGSPCEGSSIRGVICGAHTSHCRHGLSRQAFSDRLCSSLKHDPHKPDRQLTGEGFEHSTQPCRVWCHLSDSELIRNKGQFPDGAPCGHQQFCVSGVCLPVGCNKKAVIESVEDCPGNHRQLSKWHEWSPWSECSVSCGSGGQQQRKRECFDPLRLRQCKGASEDIRRCLPPPPECSQISEWGEWSRCDAECGEGTETRKRICLQGDCEEETVEKRQCHLASCWEEWSDWSECSLSCDGGHRSRDRTCPDDTCFGQSLQVEPCNTQRCPVDAWGDWLPCSVSCGIGFQIRERLCDGVLCPTANKQARTCNEQTCPAADASVVWHEWNEWSDCSQTCGEGSQRRERDCRKGDCPPWDSVEHRRCVNAACASWTEWSEWDVCQSCSESETTTRQRSCSSTFSFTAHNDCEGPAVEVESCDQLCHPDSFPNKRNIEILTARGRKRIVAHGGRILPVNSEKWANWNEWTDCSASCGGGNRQRTRLCIGSNCQQPLQAEKENCNKQQCNDGSYWGGWTDWTDCSVSCGENGYQTRRRRCTAFFSFQCSGSSHETRACLDTKPCASEQSVADARLPSWSAWSPWSTCSCFTSLETRRRFCHIGDPAVQGFCSGPILEQRPCSARNCAAVPGGWSVWSDWSECSKDCQGTGHQIRNRMCSEPIPANKGPYCTGYSFDQRSCTSDKVCGVAVDGGWTEWTDWSDCSDPCNNGHKSRTRFCSNPRPAQGGEQCYGSDFELQPCADPSKCSRSIDGGWGGWSSWSECPETCGFALQSRHRACDSPPPSEGGKHCHGIAIQSSTCYTDFCDESVDGEWSPWNEWSTCLGNCGVGSRNRVRACVSPPPSVGGAPCFGRSAELEECQEENAFCSRFVHHSQVLDAQVHNKST